MDNRQLFVAIPKNVIVYVLDIIVHFRLRLNIENLFYVEKINKEIIFLRKIIKKISYLIKVDDSYINRYV